MFNKKSSIFQGFLSKLSQTFMFPIAILPFAGLLLGIGGIIGANTNQIKLANFLKVSGEIIFANLPVFFAMSIGLVFAKHNKAETVFLIIMGYLLFTASQSVFINLEDFSILSIYKGKWIELIITKNLGITSLNTSLFGGITIGFVVSFIVNRFAKINLPNYLNFFSGIRFIPLILIPIMLLTNFLFLLVWPIIGLGIFSISKFFNNLPIGLETFLYGATTRALMPFGLHHIFIGLVFQSSFGGIIEKSQLIEIANKLNILNSFEIQTILKSFEDKTIIEGDQNIWNFINSLPFNSITYDKGNKIPLFKWIKIHLNHHAGKFIQDYATYLGLIQGIGLAIIFTAKKENKKKTFILLGSSMFVAFLTGITEPIEFTFLFLAPYFYYLFYVPFSGLSYWLAYILDVHIGVSFARGFIDFVIYGILPFKKGTNFYMIIPIALIELLISFVVFTYIIKKFDLKTPGRDDQIILVTKKDYKNSINNEVIKQYIEAYGGKQNILEVFACATRLRVKVKNYSLVNKNLIKELGSQGFIEKENYSQNILGGKALIIANLLNSILDKN